MTSYYKVPELLLTKIIGYLESTELPYRDVKAIIHDIRTTAVPIDQELPGKAAEELN